MREGEPLSLKTEAGGEYNRVKERQVVLVQVLVALSCYATCALIASRQIQRSKRHKPILSLFSERFPRKKLNKRSVKKVKHAYSMLWRERRQ